MSLFLQIRKQDKNTKVLLLTSVCSDFISLSATLFKERHVALPNIQNNNNNMKSMLLLAAVTLMSTAFVAADDIICYPAAVQSPADLLFVSFQSSAYKYTIPDLSLQITKSYNQYLCGPGSLANNVLTFAGNQENSNSTNLSVVDLSITSQSDQPAPYPNSYPTSCVTIGTDDYCFDYSNDRAAIVRKTGGQVAETIVLPVADTSAYGIITDPDVAGRIHVATHTCQYRGCTQLQYYAIATNPMAIVTGPVALPGTVGSGCPVQPSLCSGDVLLTGTFNARNDIVSYAYSNGANNEFKVNLVTVDARCEGAVNSVVLGSTLQPVARCQVSTVAPSTDAPSTVAPSTSAPSAEPTTGAPTTAAPSTVAPSHPTDCWTCPSGMVHYWEIPGASAEDRCACYPSDYVPSPGTGTTTTTTTSAPAPQTTKAAGENISGNNNARTSSAKAVVASGVVLALALAAAL